MEYDYAVERGKPVMGFIHADPGSIPVDRTERQPKDIKKLEKFREKVCGRSYRTWSNPYELGLVVTQSCLQLIRQVPAEGWVRAGNAKTPEDLEKVGRLYERIEELESELNETKAQPFSNVGDLAYGPDTITLNYSFKGNNYVSKFTWEHIFNKMGKLLLNSPHPNFIKNQIEQMIVEGLEKGDLKSDVLGKMDDQGQVELWFDDFVKIQIQFLALKLIELDTSGGMMLWRLTPHAQDYLVRLLAIRRENQDGDSGKQER